MTFKKLRALAEGAETIQGNEEEANMDIVNMFLTTDEDNPLLPTDIIKKLNDVKEGTPLFIVHHVFGKFSNVGLIEIKQEYSVDGAPPQPPGYQLFLMIVDLLTPTQKSSF